MQRIIKQLFFCSMFSMLFVSSIANGETNMDSYQVPPQMKIEQKSSDEASSEEAPVQTKCQKLIQYQLPANIKAQYAPKEGAAIALSKVFHLSGIMSFSLNQRNDDTYALTIKATSSNAKNDQGYLYFSELNKDASIKREESYRIQNNEKILEKKVTAQFESQPFLGDVKVITIVSNKKGIDDSQDSEDAGKEWIVNPEDTVLTLCQMIVWIGTVRQIDSEGVLVRLIVDDKPLPVIIKKQQSKKALVYTAYAAPNLKIESDPKNYLFKFIFPPGRSKVNEFMFPQQVWLNVKGKPFIIEKEQ